MAKIAFDTLIFILVNKTNLSGANAFGGIRRINPLFFALLFSFNFFINKNFMSNLQLAILRTCLTLCIDF